MQLVAGRPSCCCETLHVRDDTLRLRSVKRNSEIRVGMAPGVPAAYSRLSVLRAFTLSKQRFRQARNHVSRTMLNRCVSICRASCPMMTGMKTWAGKLPSTCSNVRFRPRCAPDPAPISKSEHCDICFGAAVESTRGCTRR